MSVSQELQALMALRDAGELTPAEYASAKAALLAHQGRPGGALGPGAQVGHYRLIEHVGEGGWGVVYRARHVHDGVAQEQGGDVAIKLIHTEYANHGPHVERFFREALLGMRLTHPNLLRVFETVQDAGRVGMVMAWARGRLLSAMVGRETGPIPWERAKPLVWQLLDAVAYAHEEGVVHRDLKPANIMVDGEGRLKVLDFGVAKATWERRTKTGMGLGTVDYMAPEQFTAAADVDLRADVYALGVTLYEMLSGRLPWKPDASEFEIVDAKRSADFPPPTKHFPNIPMHVVRAVMHCLAASPRERPSNVRILRDALSDPPTPMLPLRQVRARAAERSTALVRRAPGAPHPVKPASHPILSFRISDPLVLPAAVVGTLIGVAALLVVGDRLRRPKPEVATLEPPPSVAVPAEVVPPAPKVVPPPASGVAPLRAAFDSPTLGRMAFIPGGTFMMGCVAGRDDVAAGCDADESPVRHLLLGRDFYMMESEVTQGMWRSVMGENPAEFAACGASCPVEQVSWNAVQLFIARVSARDDVTYRLPTEAEWEYAARGGASFPYAGAAEPDSVGWSRANGRGSSHPVCTKVRNGFGLCDMSGNVWEWTTDAYAPYPSAAPDLRVQPGATAGRVFRGGGWNSDVIHLRAANRSQALPDARGTDVGFRLIWDHLSPSNGARREGVTGSTGSLPPRVGPGWAGQMPTWPPRSGEVYPVPFPSKVEDKARPSPRPVDATPRAHDGDIWDTDVIWEEKVKSPRSTSEPDTRRPVALPAPPADAEGAEGQSQAPSRAEGAATPTTPAGAGETSPAPLPNPKVPQQAGPPQPAAEASVRGPL
jgi:serine/threonine-protein kinase